MYCCKLNQYFYITVTGNVKLIKKSKKRTISNFIPFPSKNRHNVF